ncbi:MAG: 2-dehydro-3-deoxyphosphogluconate aldolase, partial [Clostridiales bacterium]
MEKILKQLRTIGLIPVVCIDNAENAVPLAKALKLGG